MLTFTRKRITEHSKKSVDKYVCSLSEETLEKAKKELGEDPNERAGSVQAFREWLEREPWVSAPTNSLFLLSFLRVGKFSQLRARERLGNFMNQFDKRLENIVGHDPGDPKCLDIVREGAYIILPGKNKRGGRIILQRVGAIDIEAHSYAEFKVATVPLFHAFMFFDEEVQVNGMTFLADYGGAKTGVITWMGIDKIRHTGEFVNNAFPARLKGLNYYNVGPVFEAGMEIFKPFLSKKMKERIKVRHTMVSVYDTVDKSVMPEEYLPDDYTGPSAGKIADIIEENIKELILDPVRREFLKDFYSGIYKADLEGKPSETEATASFRKLNVS